MTPSVHSFLHPKFGFSISYFRGLACLSWFTWVEFEVLVHMYTTVCSSLPLTSGDVRLVPLWVLILIGHLYLSGVRLGVDLGSDTKMVCD